MVNMMNKENDLVVSMPAKSRYSIFLRLISWVIIITFSWQQTGFSSDYTLKRWESNEKKTARTYSLIDAIQQQKKQQDDLHRKAMAEYHRNAAVGGIFEDVRLNQYMENMEQMFANMQMQEQIWKARNLVYHANTTYMQVKNPDGSLKVIWSRAGMTIAVLNEYIDDGFGNVSFRDTYDMQYNDKGLLTSYNAKETDRFGAVTYIQWYGAQYTDDSVYYGGYDTNANKNLIGYSQVTVTREEAVDQSTGQNLVYEHKTTKHVYNCAYSGKDMTSCIEEGWDEAKGDYYFVRNGMGYDSNHNLTSYHEEGWSQDKGANWTDWSGTYKANPYAPDRYLLENYNARTWSESANEVSEISWQGTYQGTHMTGFVQTEQTPNGGITCHTREDIVYEGNLVTGYKDTYTDNNGNTSMVEFTGVYDLKENLVHSIKKITDAQGNIITTENSAAFNAIRQLIGYEETSFEGSAIDPDAFNSRVVWSGSYDTLGRIISYHQEKKLSDNPGVIEVTDYSGISYDAISQMADFTGTVRVYGTDASGKTVDVSQVTTRSNIVFDDKGSLLSYTETAKSSGTNLYGYDVDLTVTKDVIFNTGKDIKDVDNTITYAISSQYRETIRYQGVSSVSLPANWADFTQEQKIAYLEQVDFSIGGDNVDFSALDEDEKAALVNGEQVETDEGLKLVLTPDGVKINIKINSQRQDVCQYHRNASGQVVGFNIVSTDTAAPDNVTTSVRSMIQYNAVGMVTGFMDSVTTNKDNLTTESLVEAIIYDAASRMSGQVRTEHVYGKSDSGAESDTTIVSTQSEMSYDAQGNSIGFTEVLLIPYSNLQTTSYVSGITYNGLDQVYAKNTRAVTVSTFEGIDYEVTNLQITSSSIYNSLGQLISGSNYTIHDGFAELSLAQAVSSLGELKSQTQLYLSAAENNLLSAEQALALLTDEQDIELQKVKIAYYRKEIAALNTLQAAVSDLEAKTTALSNAIETEAEADIVDSLAYEARLSANAMINAFTGYTYAIELIYTDALARSEMLNSLIENAKESAATAFDFVDVMGTYQVTDIQADGRVFTYFYRGDPAKPATAKLIRRDEKSVTGQGACQVTDIYTLVDGELERTSQVTVIVDTAAKSITETTIGYISSSSNGMIEDTKTVTVTYYSDADMKNVLSSDILLYAMKDVLNTDPVSVLGAVAGILPDLNQQQKELLINSLLAALASLEFSTDSVITIDDVADIVSEYESLAEALESDLVRIVAALKGAAAGLTQAQADKLKSCMEDFILAIEQDTTIDYEPGSNSQFTLTARQHTKTFTDEQGRVITNYYVIDINQEADSEGNYALQLVSKKVVDGSLISFYAIDGDNDVLVKTIETKGNEEITTIYEFSDGIVSEITVETKTYNLSPDSGNARLTQWVTETYDGSSISSDKLASRVSRTGYEYYSDQAGGQFYNTLTGVVVTEESFSQGESLNLETTSLTLESALSLINTYNSLNDLSAAFSKSVIKPYRNTLYGDYDVTGDYGLSGQAIEYYESIYTNIPLRQNIQTVSVWNNDYDSYGNVVSSENLNLSFGLGVEQALYTQYTASGILLWIDFYQSQLADKARALRQEAGALSADRHDDGLVLIQQADAIDALITKLDAVRSLAQAAVAAVDGLLEAISSSDQDIIDAEIVNVRKTIESVMTAISKVIISAHSLAPSVSLELDRVNALLDAAQDELSAAEEAGIDTSDIQQRADALSDTVDIYNSYESNMEEIVSNLYSLKERQDLLAETVPFGMNQQVSSTQYDVIYNDLGQAVSYKTKLTQFGNGRSESFAAFYKSGYIYQSVVSVNELITAMELSNEFKQLYAERLSDLNALALKARQSAKDLFDAIDSQSGEEAISGLRDAYRQALSALNSAVLNLCLDMVDDARLNNSLLADLNNDIDEANEQLSELNTQLIAAGRAQNAKAEALIKSKIDALTLEIADMESRRQSCQEEVSALNFTAGRLTAISECADELSQAVPGGIHTEQVTNRRDIVYDINNRVTGYEEDTLSSGFSTDSVWFAQSQAESLYIRVEHLISNLLEQAVSLRNFAADCEADNRLDEANDALDEAGDMESKAESLEEICNILSSIINTLALVSSLGAKGDDAAQAYQQALELYRRLNTALAGIELEYTDALEGSTDELSGLQEEAYQAELAAEYLESSIKSIGTYSVTEKTQEGDQIIEIVSTYELGANSAAKLISKKETISTLNQYGQVIEEKTLTCTIYTVEDDSLNPVNNGDPITVISKVKEEVTVFTYAVTSGTNPSASRTIVYTFDSASGEKVFASAWDISYAYENGLLKSAVKNIYSDDKLDSVKGIEESVYEYAAGSSNISTMTVSTSWQVNDGINNAYELSSQVVTNYSYDSLDNLISQDKRGYSYKYSVDALSGETCQKTLTSWTVKEYSYSDAVMVSSVEKEYRSFVNGIPKQMTMKSTKYALDGSSGARISSQSIVKYNVSPAADLEEGFPETALTLTSYYEEYRQITEVDLAHPEAGVKYLANIFERNAVTGELVQTQKDVECSWWQVSLLRLDAEAKKSSVERKNELIERLNYALVDFALSNQYAQSVLNDVPFDQEAMYTVKRSDIVYNQIGQAVSYVDTITADSEHISRRSAWFTLINTDTLLQYLNYTIGKSDELSDEQSQAVNELLELAQTVKDKAASLYEAITNGLTSEQVIALRDACARAFEDFSKKASEYASLVSLYAIEGISLDVLGYLEGLKVSIADMVNDIEASIAGMEILKSLAAYNPDEWDSSVSSEISALESDLELLSGIEGIYDEECVNSIISRLVTALNGFNQALLSSERLVYYSEIASGLDELYSRLSDYRSNLASRVESRQSILSALYKMLSNNNYQARARDIEQAIDTMVKQFDAEERVLEDVDSILRQVDNTRSVLSEAVSEANRIATLSQSAAQFLPFADTTVTVKQKSEITYNSLGQETSFTETVSCQGLTLESVWQAISDVNDTANIIFNAYASTSNSADRSALNNMRQQALNLKAELEALKGHIASGDNEAVVQAQASILESISFLATLASEFKSAKDSSIDAYQHKSDILSIIYNGIKELSSTDSAQQDALDTAIGVISADFEQAEKELAQAQKQCFQANRVYEAVVEACDEMPYKLDTVNITKWHDAVYDSQGMLVSSKQTDTLSGISAQSAVSSMLKVIALIEDINNAVKTVSADKLTKYMGFLESAIDAKTKLASLVLALINGTDYQDKLESAADAVNSLLSQVNAFENDLSKSFDEKIALLQSGMADADILDVAGFIQQSDYASAYAGILNIVDSVSAKVKSDYSYSDSIESLSALDINAQACEALKQAGIISSDNAALIRDAQDAYENLRDALERAAIISDLDSRPGQELAEAVSVISKIMPKNISVSTKTEKSSTIYNDLGQAASCLLTQEDADYNILRSRKENMQYDQLGRLIAEHIAEYSKKLTLGKRYLKQYAYDDASRITSARQVTYDSGGAKTSAQYSVYAYNSLGHICLQEENTFAVDPDTGAQYLSSRQVSRNMSYDTAGNVLSSTLDYYAGENGVISELSSSKRIASMTYDHKARLIAQKIKFFNESGVYTSAKETLYTYDGAGNIVQASDYKYDADMFITGKVVTNTLYGWNKYRRIWEAYMKITQRYDNYFNLYYTKADNIGIAPVTPLQQIASASSLIKTPKKYKTYDLDGETSGEIEILDADQALAERLVLSNTEYDGLGNVISQSITHYDADGKFSYREVISNIYGGVFFTADLGSMKSLLLAQTKTIYDENVNFVSAVSTQNFYTNPDYDESQISLGTDAYGNSYTYVRVELKAQPKLYQQAVSRLDANGDVLVDANGEKERTVEQFGTYQFEEQRFGIDAVSRIVRQDSGAQQLLDRIQALLDYNLISENYAASLLRLLSDLSGSEAGISSSLLTQPELQVTGAETITPAGGIAYEYDEGANLLTIFTADGARIEQQSTDNGYILTEYDKDGNLVRISTVTEISQSRHIIDTVYYGSDGTAINSQRRVEEYYESGPYANMLKQVIIINFADGNFTNVINAQIIDYQSYTSSGQVERQSMRAYADYDMDEETAKNIISIRQVSIEYDAEGRTKRQQTDTFNDEQLSEHINTEVVNILAYDSEDRIIRQTTALYAGFENNLPSSLISIQEITTEYDDSGRVERQATVIWNDEAMTEGISAQVVSDILYDDEDRIIGQKIAVYGQVDAVNGIIQSSLINIQVISGITYHYNDLIASQTVVTYNDLGLNQVINKQVISDIAYDSEDRVASQTIATFADDSDQNLINVQKISGI
ncbi:MAG: hypothetical protein PHV77_07110, partial [Candidatus Omnitrophica bacterium]|nr:hypothetical protein [Candidatus Omnitrophota bacterium]